MERRGRCPAVAGCVGLICGHDTIVNTCHPSAIYGEGPGVRPVFHRKINFRSISVNNRPTHRLLFLFKAVNKDPDVMWGEIRKLTDNGQFSMLIWSCNSLYMIETRP